MDSNRIDESLSQSPSGLWPFVVGGYPSIAVTKSLLLRLVDLPIRGVEIGFPFSDPVADGPVIQRAFTAVLDKGAKVREVFAMLADVRPCVSFPLLAMVSASIVYRIGISEFVDMAAGAGIDGLIVPDVPVEEAGEIAGYCAEKNLRFPMLVAPTTPADRREKIADIASGFLYYVSVQGTTGQRDQLAANMESEVRALREQTDLPVLVGFGISDSEQVREVCRFANGGIVGSAIVHRMTQEIDRGASEQAVVDAAIDFVRDMAIH